MPKQSGIGANLLIGGNNLSPDIGAVDNIGNERAFQDVTSIASSAHERLHLLADPQIEFTGYFNPTGAHPVLSALPTTDQVISYLAGTAAGDAVASATFKQVSYDPSRGADGSLTVKVAASGSDGTPLSWGNQLTAGVATFTTAGNTASYDLTAATVGGYFVVHCTAFTGTSVTVKLQASPDNVTFSDLSPTVSTVFTAIGAARLVIPVSTTVARYVRANLAGTFTNAKLSISYQAA